MWYTHFPPKTAHRETRRTPAAGRCHRESRAGAGGPATQGRLCASAAAMTSVVTARRSFAARFGEHRTVLAGSVLVRMDLDVRPAQVRVQDLPWGNSECGCAMSQIITSNHSRDTRWRSRVLLGLLLLVPFALALTGCETMQVGSDYDRAANFSTFHSFTWLPREQYGVSNPLVVERTEEAITSALEQKGYRYVTNAADADFAVDFTIGSHERVDVHTYPRPYSWPWYGYGRYWWGYTYWGTGVDVTRYREGTLAIDVFDGKTHRPVWHGWAKKPLSQKDIENSAAAIRDAVDAILVKFPPG